MKGNKSIAEIISVVHDSKTQLSIVKVMFSLCILMIHNVTCVWGILCLRVFSQ